MDGAYFEIKSELFLKKKYCLKAISAFFDQLEKKLKVKFGDRSFCTSTNEKLDREVNNKRFEDLRSLGFEIQTRGFKQTNFTDKGGKKLTKRI